MDTCYVFPTITLIIIAVLPGAHSLPVFVCKCDRLEGTLGTVPGPYHDIPGGWTKRGCRAGVKVKATQRFEQYPISTIERPRYDKYHTTIPPITTC